MCDITFEWVEYPFCVTAIVILKKCNRTSHHMNGTLQANAQFAFAMPTPVAIITKQKIVVITPIVLCNAVTCPHLVRSGIGTA